MNTPDRKTPEPRAAARDSSVAKADIGATPPPHASAQVRTADLLMGQRLAFAAASLTMGLCAYVNLLGMEKAMVAIAFGALALRRRGGPSLRARTGLARIGVILGCAHILLVVVLAMLYWDRFIEFFEMIERFKSQSHR
jgi:hypothetical protein